MRNREVVSEVGSHEGEGRRLERLVLIIGVDIYDDGNTGEILGGQKGDRCVDIGSEGGNKKEPKAYRWVGIPAPGCLWYLQHHRLPRRATHTHTHTHTPAALKT